MRTNEVPIRELTDTDVLRWLLAKFRCHKGVQKAEYGLWSLPPGTLTCEAQSPLDACLDEIACEREDEFLRRVKESRPQESPPAIIVPQNASQESTNE